MKYFIRKTAVLWVLAAAMLAFSCKGAVKPGERTIAVTGVSLNKTELSLVVGSNETLSATVEPATATNKAVLWKSHKPAVAEVDETGKVTAKQVGTATITVTTKDGSKTAICTVSVTDSSIAVTGVSLNKTELSLVVGSNETLSATVEPATATNKAVTWKSSKPAVAEVDETGKVTAKQAGTATITVTTKDGGKTATCEVKVLALYSITYELNGGTDNGGNPASYTVETDTITLKPVNKANHIFFGWYEKADFSGSPVTEIRKGSHGDKKLYAQLIEIKMIDIAAVTDVWIGDDSERNNKEHSISLTAYRIGESEVTQELWQAVMGENPSYFKDNAASGEVQEKRPVENVNWYQAIAFCNELTKKAAELGESQCVYSVDGHTYTKEDAENQKIPEMDMNKKGFRLPTEAEWEWAAMGGKKGKWAGTDSKNELEKYAWYSDDYGGDANGKTHEVKKKLANEYGLYDMTGNVGEWCWDIYDPSSPNSYRVLRGGNWLYSVNRAKRAYREISNLDANLNCFGLRLVRRS